MKVSELYDEALTASAKETPPSSAFLPPVSLLLVAHGGPHKLTLSPRFPPRQVWTALMNIKKHHFAAASQCASPAQALVRPPRACD